MKPRQTAAFVAISKLYAMFTAAQKKQFHWLLILTFITSFTDILGLASIIPVIGIVLTDSFYQKFVSLLPFLSGFSKNDVLLIVVSFFLVVIVLKNLFGLFVNYLQVRFVKNFFVTSSLNVLDKIYKQPFSEIQTTPSQEWVNKLTYMQAALTSSLAISALIVINEVMVFSITAIIICLWNWHLFLVLIVVLFPGMGIFYARVKHMIKTAGTEGNAAFVKLCADAQEMILGYMDIKIAGTEDYLKKRFKDIAQRYSILQGKKDFVMFIPTRIIEVIIFVCVVVILLYGVFFLKDLDKIVTTISLFSVVAYRSIPSVNRFVIALNTITATEYIINDPYFVAGVPTPKPVERSAMPFEKNLLFENVSFRYDTNSKEVISQCNFTIQKGETIGFVGRSGSGKSTIINNILGFLQPTSGRILIDEEPLTLSNVRDWWQIVGYVRQEVFILNTTLAENIAIGVPPEKIDADKLYRALRLSRLTELVNELPEGVSTALGERGNNLSGGQKQRIAIARAIYKGASVLIFDEATSALDTKTEEEITQSIYELGKENLTILIIAHRYTSLRYCDRIFELEEGKIVRTSTYEQLKNQAY